MKYATVNCAACNSALIICCHTLGRNGAEHPCSPLVTTLIPPAAAAPRAAFAVKLGFSLTPTTAASPPPTIPFHSGPVMAVVLDFLDPLQHSAGAVTGAGSVCWFASAGAVGETWWYRAEAASRCFCMR